MESLKSIGKQIKQEIHAAVPHLNCGQVAESARCRKPTEFIQNSSQQKTAEGLSTGYRASAPGCPLKSGNSKRAGFSVELMVSNVQQTVRKLSGAVHFSSKRVVFGSQTSYSDGLICHAVWTCRLSGILTMFVRGILLRNCSCLTATSHAAGPIFPHQSI